MKKISLLLALMLLFTLTACGQAEPEDGGLAVEEPLYLETLSVELSKGSLGAQQLSAAVKELPEVLRAYFADTGAVEVGEVRVTVGSSSSATAQALAEGGVDLAFLPAEAFLGSGSGAAVLLADAQRPQPDSELLEAGATDVLRAGASPYGGQLATRSGGSPLTWEELENARWGVSKAGAAWDCLDLWLSANLDGARAADLSQVTLYDEDEALLAAGLTGEIDILVLSREDWGQAADDGAEEALPMLAETEALCTQLAAVSPEREELAQAQFTAALEQVLQRLGKERPELMEALGAKQFTAVEDGTLDSARRLLALDGKLTA